MEKVSKVHVLSLLRRVLRIDIAREPMIRTISDIARDDDVSDGYLFTEIYFAPLAD